MRKKNEYLQATPMNKSHSQRVYKSPNTLSINQSPINKPKNDRNECRNMLRKIMDQSQKEFESLQTITQRKNDHQYNRALFQDKKRDNSFQRNANNDTLFGYDLQLNLQDNNGLKQKNDELIIQLQDLKMEKSQLLNQFEIQKSAFMEMQDKLSQSINQNLNQSQKIQCLEQQLKQLQQQNREQNINTIDKQLEKKQIIKYQEEITQLMVQIKQLNFNQIEDENQNQQLLAQKEKQYLNQIQQNQIQKQQQQLIYQNLQKFQQKIIKQMQTQEQKQNYLKSKLIKLSNIKYNIQKRIQKKINSYKQHIQKHKFNQTQEKQLNKKYKNQIDNYNNKLQILLNNIKQIVQVSSDLNFIEQIDYIVVQIKNKFQQLEQNQSNLQNTLDLQIQNNLQLNQQIEQQNQKIKQDLLSSNSKVKLLTNEIENLQLHLEQFNSNDIKQLSQDFIKLMNESQKLQEKYEKLLKEKNQLIKLNKDYETIKNADANLINSLRNEIDKLKK